MSMTPDDAMRGLPRFIELQIEKAVKPLQDQITTLQQELADVKARQDAKPATLVDRIRSAVGGGK
ncbi:hypothetical protein G7047_17200 [Diaphorobacter sp. HDW4A]|uniref:hypothetical protein n=1 Tax=Diaphorobacter sp. HDW4A TaxID=2714924 RepID=UPI00140B79F7|nr:hypothetical protein [Diaphorobacter sp. HDW4A]QIL81453.1 hypothetical protein G7047_17200 [Diaphorobacter sp. HDW4A]